MPNQDNAGPDQAAGRFARLLRNQFLVFKEFMVEASKQADNIAVWLVGMSTGSIVLIISQLQRFNPALYPALKISVFFLTLTVVFGLLFRIFHRLLQAHERENLMLINTWLAGYSEFSTEIPIELPEDASAESIALALYRLMEIDMDPELLKSIEACNDVKDWRRRYEEYAALCRDLEEAKSQTVRNMAEKFWEYLASLDGLPPQQYKQSLEEDYKSIGSRKRRLKKFCYTLYILVCASFAISVLFISCSFIKADLKANYSSAPNHQKTIMPPQQNHPAHPDKSD